MFSLGKISLTNAILAYSSEWAGESMLAQSHVMKKLNWSSDLLNRQGRIHTILKTEFW